MKVESVSVEQPALLNLHNIFYFIFPNIVMKTLYLKPKKVLSTLTNGGENATVDVVVYLWWSNTAFQLLSTT